MQASRRRYFPSPGIGPRWRWLLLVGWLAAGSLTGFTNDEPVTPPSKDSAPAWRPSDLGTPASASGLLIPGEPFPIAEKEESAPPLSVTNVASLATNDLHESPEGESLSSSNLISAAKSKAQEQLRTLQVQFDLARQQRRDKDFAQATSNLTSLLESDAPPELKRAALLELALTAQEARQYTKAQHLYSRFLALHPQDPIVPEILLRQGLLYREMGVNSLAISKFYAVMTSALRLKLAQLEYYQRLVLHAQTEVADTYYLEGKYAEAADFLRRLLRLDAPQLNKSQISFKLIRCLAHLDRPAEAAGQAEEFLRAYPGAPELPEVRFLLATALKSMGRNREALQQVLVLLKSQQATAQDQPETWSYWKRRAGNEIANQFYTEGNYLEALEVYLSLAELDQSPEWQMPVWYQIGLVYERLEQPDKAAAAYLRILEREKDLAQPSDNSSLQALLDMAQWRADFLNWHQRAELQTEAIQSRLSTNRSNLTVQ